MSFKFLLGFFFVAVLSGCEGHVDDRLSEELSKYKPSYSDKLSLSLLSPEIRNLLNKDGSHYPGVDRIEIELAHVRIESMSEFTREWLLPSRGTFGGDLNRVLNKNFNPNQQLVIVYVFKDLKYGSEFAFYVDYNGTLIKEEEVLFMTNVGKKSASVVKQSDEYYYNLKDLTNLMPKRIDRSEEVSYSVYPIAFPLMADGMSLDLKIKTHEIDHINTRLLLGFIRNYYYQINKEKQINSN